MALHKVVEMVQVLASGLGMFVLSWQPGQGGDTAALGLPGLASPLHKVMTPVDRAQSASAVCSGVHPTVRKSVDCKVAVWGTVLFLALREPSVCAQVAAATVVEEAGAVESAASAGVVASVAAAAVMLSVAAAAVMLSVAAAAVMPSVAVAAVVLYVAVTAVLLPALVAAAAVTVPAVAARVVGTHTATEGHFGQHEEHQALAHNRHRWGPALQIQAHSV